MTLLTHLKAGFEKAYCHCACDGCRPDTEKRNLVYGIHTLIISGV
jgi:hypothetical protein